jgi:hypothetical protein
MYTVWVDILGYGIPVIYGNTISYRYLIRPGDWKPRSLAWTILSESPASLISIAAIGVDLLLTGCCLLLKNIQYVTNKGTATNKNVRYWQQKKGKKANIGKIGGGGGRLRP